MGPASRGPSSWIAAEVVAQQAGMAGATLGTLSARPPKGPVGLSRSRGLQQAVVTQQRLGGGVATAEGTENGSRLAAAAQAQHGVGKAAAGLRYRRLVVQACRGAREPAATVSSGRGAGREQERPPADAGAGATASRLAAAAGAGTAARARGHQRQPEITCFLKGSKGVGAQHLCPLIRVVAANKGDRWAHAWLVRAAAAPAPARPQPRASAQDKCRPGAPALASPCSPRAVPSREDV